MAAAGRGSRPARTGRAWCRTPDEHQAAVEAKDGDGAIGASDIIVEVPADDALGQLAQVVTAKAADRSRPSAAGSPPGPDTAADGPLAAHQQA